MDALLDNADALERRPDALALLKPNNPPEKLHRFLRYKYPSPEQNEFRGSIVLVVCERNDIKIERNVWRIAAASVLESEPPTGKKKEIKEEENVEAMK